MNWATLIDYLSWSPDLLLNFGFTLFAIDALLTSSVSNHLRVEYAILCAAEEADGIRKSMQEALTGKAEDTSPGAELSRLRGSRAETKVKAFRDYMKERKSESLIDAGFKLAFVDIIFFVFSSIINAINCTNFCAWAAASFIILIVAHLAFFFVTKHIRKRASSLQDEALKAIYQLKDVCILRGAILDEEKFASSLQKITP